MKWVGLTGGLGSGKSTVARFLEELGAPVLSADRLAHDALLPGSAIFSTIVQRWGPRILSKDGTIDRRELGKIVFQRREELTALEELVHPYVRGQMSRWRQQREAEHLPIAVYEIPLLFEKNLKADFDAIILVTAPRGKRIERLKKREGWTESEILARLDKQMPDSAKVSDANWVIDNDGTEAELRAKVLALFQVI